MVTSMNKDDWKEDEMEMKRREDVQACTLPQVMRQLFPFKVKLLKNVMYRDLIQAGDVIQYARVKQTPAFYPIEAVIFDKNGGKRMVFMNSSEGEVWEA
jgi:hypothetical protein